MPEKEEYEKIVDFVIDFLFSIKDEGVIYPDTIGKLIAIIQLKILNTETENNMDERR